MSLMRTTSCSGCPPPRTVWRPLLPRLGCLLMPRRSSPAPMAASVPVLPRAAREAPLVASTCCVFSLAWDFVIVFYLQDLCNVVHPFVVPLIPLSSCPRGSPPFFLVYILVLLPIISSLSVDSTHQLLHIDAIPGTRTLHVLVELQEAR
jgi:hypothetical protein